NINAVQVAANDSPGELEFVQNTTNSGGSKRVPHVRAREYFYDKPSIIKVAANRLDDVLTEDFDLIVIDIKGSEVFVLRGMPRILSQAKHLIIEYLPHHLKQVGNVSVKEFLAPISPNFDDLHVPSKSLKVKRSDFEPVLEDMYQQNEEDQGI